MFLVSLMITNSTLQQQKCYTNYILLQKIIFALEKFAPKDHNQL